MSEARRADWLFPVILGALAFRFFAEQWPAEMPACPAPTASDIDLSWTDLKRAGYALGNNLRTAPPLSSAYRLQTGHQPPPTIGPPPHCPTAADTNSVASQVAQLAMQPPLAPPAKSATPAQKYDPDRCRADDVGCYRAWFECRDGMLIEAALYRGLEDRLYRINADRDDAEAAKLQGEIISAGAYRHRQWKCIGDWPGIPVKDTDALFRCRAAVIEAKYLTVGVDRADPAKRRADAASYVEEAEACEKHFGIPSRGSKLREWVGLSRGGVTLLTQPSQPLCVSQDDLKAYLLAGLANDQSAKWDCALLPPGRKLHVIEVISRSEIGDVILAETVAQSGKAPMSGYTMNVGLKPAAR